MSSRPRIRAALLRMATLWLILPGTAAEVRAAPLVADLSDHLIGITTGFSGTEVLLFGATEGEGDVIVVVRGPEAETTIRRKQRVAGIWVNGGGVTFEHVPGFYAVASSRPLGEIVPPELLARQQIGAEHLQFQVVGDVSERRARRYRAALIASKQRAGLFGNAAGKVTFLDGRLFRTSIYFPSNVPTGSYLVEVLMIRDGDVVSAQTTPLAISRTGIGAEIFEFAHDQSAAYGVLAIIWALMAGWAAHLVFRRV